jgi:pyocin large subunit-like protein
LFGTSNSSAASNINKQRLQHVEIIPSKGKKGHGSSSSSSAGAGVGKASEQSAAAVTTPVGLELMTKSSNNKITHIDSLSFRKYNVGAMVYGYILHISDDHVVVSLPGGLTGSVAYSEISDSIHKLYVKQMNEQTNKLGKRKVVSLAPPVFRI